MLPVGNEPENLVAFSGSMFIESTPVNWLKRHQMGKAHIRCIGFMFPYKRDATGYKKQWVITSVNLSVRDLLHVLKAGDVATQFGSV
jgi:hypothetical protein